MNYDEQMNMNNVEFGNMPPQAFLLGLLSAFVFETNTVSFLTQKRKIGDVLICENVEC